MAWALKSDSLQKLRLPFFIAIVVSIVTLYAVVGCARDWVVISGLSINALGAYLIAVPDFGHFSRVFYAGKLQDAYDSVIRHPKRRHIPTGDQWYPVFLDEMDDAFGGEDVSANSEFWIDQNAGSYNLFHREDPTSDAKPMALSTVDGQIIDTIQQEEIEIRKVGAALLFPGFALQILGLIVDGTLGLGLVC